MGQDRGQSTVSVCETLSVCYSRFIIWMSELVTNTKFLTMSIMDRGERGAGRL